MTTYETLSAVADTGGTHSVEPRVVNIKFKDQYEQVSTTGRNNSDRKMSLTFTGDSAECDELIAFFDRHRGIVPFWFSFDKVEPERLMLTDGAYTKNHVGGLKYNVTVALKGFGGLYVNP